jgi:hypothetical protein
MKKQIKFKHCELTAHVLDWLNGELLGDGSLTKCSLFTTRFRYASKYLEYINYVIKTLNSFGIELSGKVNVGYGNTYLYSSRCYCELLLLREVWYPDGKKVVPGGLRLTPVVCRQWYIGDGSLITKRFYKPYIVLYTCGFPISDVEWLIKQLWEIGILATRRPSDNSIGIATCSTLDFLNYIGQCPVECYQYKWRY